MILKEVIVGFNMMVLVNDEQEIDRIVKDYAADEAQNNTTIFSVVKCQEIKKLENLPKGWSQAIPWSAVDIGEITCKQFLDGEDPTTHEANITRVHLVCEDCATHCKLYQCHICDEVLCDKCLKMHRRECKN